jgi:hypothetical protein
MSSICLHGSQLCYMMNLARAIYSMSLSLGGAQGIALNTFLTVVVLGLGLDSMSALYTAYNKACLRLENESWLRNNCRDPVFFSNMRAHTTVCADVEANARVGAFWAAMREVSDGARAYVEPFVLPFVITGVLVAFVIPVCCMSCQRFMGGASRRFKGIPMHRQSSYLKDL